VVEVIDHVLGRVQGHESEDDGLHREDVANRQLVAGTIYKIERAGENLVHLVHQNMVVVATA